MNVVHSEYIRTFSILSSMVGVLYITVLIKRIGYEMEYAMEEQCRGHSRTIGFMDQVFALKQVYKK